MGRGAGNSVKEGWIKVWTVSIVVIVVTQHLNSSQWQQRTVVDGDLAGDIFDSSLSGLQLSHYYYGTDDNLLTQQNATGNLLIGQKLLNLPPACPPLHFDFIISPLYQKVLYYYYNLLVCLLWEKWWGERLVELVS